jgi:prolycopene isomerase
MDSYDAVVIGAGNGGLTASTALAQKGLNVLLLERHNIPGGCATSFCRGRFEFEVALHQLSGMGTRDKPGPLRMMLGSLGILDELDLVEGPDLYGVSMPDGSRLTLRPDRSQVLEVLQARFPPERQAIGEFFDLVYKFAGELIGAFYFRDPEASREKYPLLCQYALKPASEVLDALFKDPLLKAVVSVYWAYLGLPPTRLSFAYLALLLFSYIEFKPFHIKGGSQALSNALLNRFLAHGGTVRFNCGARKVLVENGSVRGVVTEQGDTVAARHVVSNVSPLATYLEMMAPDQVPPEALTDMRGRSLSISALTLYLGFDCDPGNLGLEATTTFLLKDIDFTDKVFGYMEALEVTDEALAITCYDMADPDFSPPGACQASLLTLKYGEPWLRVPPEHYFRVKNRCGDSLLRRAEEVFPGLRDHIEELEVATPLTHMRYLGHPNGAIYGFEHYIKDAMFFQPGRRSPVKGLFFASGWAGDAGFQTTLEAGRNAANAILKALGR